MEKNKKRFFGKKDLVGWVIMLPAIILFAFYVWQPLLNSVRLSLYETKGYDLIKFIGFENYRAVLLNPNFMAAFQNTFKYIIVSLLIGFIVPIIIAVLISETIHFKGLFRVGVYFPNMIPGMATVILWTYFLSPGEVGVLNIILSKFGVEPLVWLNNSAWTIPLIVITMTWKSAGATALIYMAAISGISPDLYEAATIDGAGILKRIQHISIPSIFSLGKTLLILQIISVFQILYEPLVMTGGGPNNASISIMQLVYNYAFRDFHFSEAAALSVMVCLILVFLSGLYMYLTRDKEEQ